MEELIQLKSFPVETTLDILLQDKTTKKNIIWATKSYAEFGEKYTDSFQMTKGALLGINPILLQPRAFKALEDQQQRTKSKAEVFTPSWICNKMNNSTDEEWFGRKDVFNIEGEKSWKADQHRIEFPEKKTWKKYVDSKRLEITCGEAPFIISRYDASSGEIIPIQERIGQLDRKLRVVGENVNDEEEWLKWAYRAFQSVYGYEFQGDNLLIARVNLLMSFVDYLDDKWDREPTVKELREIANIISWNFWQMDGLNDCVPLGVPEEATEQLTLFDFDDEPKEEKAPLCKIKDWRANSTDLFQNYKKEK